MVELLRLVDHLCPPGGGVFHPAFVVSTAAYIDRLGAEPQLAALLANDGWQLVLVCLLVIAAKSYCDAPVKISSLCHSNSPFRHGWPALRASDVAAIESRLLHMLDWRTTVLLAEFDFVTNSRVDLGAREDDIDVCA